MASSHSPSSRSTLARFTEHSPRNGSSPRCASHHSLRSRVHTRARSTSHRSRQLAITAQYAGPAARTPTRPDEMASMTRSMQANASMMRPLYMSERPRLIVAMHLDVGVVCGPRQRDRALAELDRLVEATLAERRGGLREHRRHLALRRPSGDAAQLEQARHPCARPHRVAVIGEGEADPEHAADRGIRLAGVEVGEVGGIPRALALGLAAEEPRRQPELVELRGRELGAASRQLVVAGDPVDDAHRACPGHGASIRPRVPAPTSGGILAQRAILAAWPAGTTASPCSCSRAPSRSTSASRRRSSRTRQSMPYEVRACGAAARARHRR